MEVLTGACNTEYLAGFLPRHPVFPPFASPSYSNAAFAILGLVVEAVTGKDYATALDEGLLRPLGLTRTSVRPPNDTEGDHVILNRWNWERDLGAENP